MLDKVKASTFLATDRVHVLRQAIICCRKAGTVSIPGVYVGMGDKIPLYEQRTLHQDGPDPRSGLYQAAPEADRRRQDRSKLRRHAPASLEEAPAMYKKFRDKEDGVIKVVLRPGR